MAKVKAPLLSLGATGQLGKTLVMSTWKGIKTAREYVVPANPRTSLQLIQRALMTVAVALGKLITLTTTQKTAWNLFASVSGKAQSGFNCTIRETLKMLKAYPSGTTTDVYFLFGTSASKLNFFAIKTSGAVADSFMGDTLTVIANAMSLNLITENGGSGGTVATTETISESGYAQAYVDDGNGVRIYLTGIVPVIYVP